MPDSKLTTLTDAATDVLYALFFRGALLSGDVPSKSGANELLDAGLTCAKHTATPFGGEDYFTYLTAEGQDFAIKYLAETCFGVAQKSESKALIKESIIQPASITAGAIKGEAVTRAEAIAKDDLARKEGMPTMRIGSVDVEDDSIVFKDGDGAVRVRLSKLGETSTVETIEQRTLSAVLSNSLHKVDPAQAGDAAVKLAQAVKSAFQTLNSGFAAGGYVSSQWGIKMDPSVSHTTECVDKSERLNCESDAHDPVSLEDIKDSRKDDMLTFGGYPGALFAGKVDFNAAAAETKVVLSNEMKEAIKEVVRKCIEEQTRPGGLLHRW